MPYQTLIVDDEEPARALLRLHLSKVPELVLAGSCNSAIEARRILAEQPIDILLLDIHMDDITGLDLLRMLTVQPATILTTAYSDYALESYELDVIDYLVKPISFDRFFKAASKAMESLQSRPSNPKPAHADDFGKASYIFLKVDQKLVKILLEELLFVEAYGEYVKVYTRDKIHISLRTLTSLEEVLPSVDFFRLHRSYLVNIQHIAEIEDGMVRIQEHEIPISRRLKEEFFECLKKGGIV